MSCPAPSSVHCRLWGLNTGCYRAVRGSRGTQWVVHQGYVLALDIAHSFDICLYKTGEILLLRKPSLTTNIFSEPKPKPNPICPFYMSDYDVLRLSLKLFSYLPRKPTNLTLKLLRDRSSSKSNFVFLLFQN